MKTWTARALTIVGLVAFGGVGFTYAQQHDHSQMTQSKAANPKDEDNAIFCPTMKTGQLCSHGTASVLQLKGDQADAWMALARKYNKAVDTATLQLFKDAEGTLTPEQLSLLKAWFAVGLNPEINQLLYGKGLGPKDMPAAAKK